MLHKTNDIKSDRTGKRNRINTILVCTRTTTRAMMVVNGQEEEIDGCKIEYIQELMRGRCQ